MTNKITPQVPVTPAVATLLHTSRLLPGVGSGTQAAGGALADGTPRRSHTVNAIVDAYDSPGPTAQREHAITRASDLVASPVSVPGPLDQYPTATELDALCLYLKCCPLQKPKSGQAHLRVLGEHVLHLMDTRVLTPPQYLRILSVMPEEELQPAARTLASIVSGLEADDMQALADLFPKTIHAYQTLVAIERIRRDDKKYLAKATPEVVNATILSVVEYPQYAFSTITNLCDYFTLHLSEAIALLQAADVPPEQQKELQRTLRSATRDAARGAIGETAREQWTPEIVVKAMARDRACMKTALGALEAVLASASPAPIETQPQDTAQPSSALTLLFLIAKDRTKRVTIRKKEFKESIENLTLTSRELLCLAIAGGEFASWFVTAGLTRVQTPFDTETLEVLDHYLGATMDGRCAFVAAQRHSASNPNLRPKPATEIVDALVQEVSRYTSTGVRDVIRNAADHFTFEEGHVAAIAGATRGLDENAVRKLLLPKAE